MGCVWGEVARVCSGDCPRVRSIKTASFPESSTLCIVWAFEMPSILFRCYVWKTTHKNTVTSYAIDHTVNDYGKLKIFCSSRSIFIFFYVFKWFSHCNGPESALGHHACSQKGKKISYDQNIKILFSKLPHMTWKDEEKLRNGSLKVNLQYSVGWVCAKRAFKMQKVTLM